MTVTLVRLDNNQPFVERAELINNANDGSVSFKLDDGTFVGQEPWLVGQPSTYGVRYPNSTDCGAYQRFTRYDSTVVSLTRPQDVPMIYGLGVGKAY